MIRAHCHVCVQAAVSEGQSSFVSEGHQVTQVTNRCVQYLVIIILYYNIIQYNIIYNVQQIQLMLKETENVCVTVGLRIFTFTEVKQI